MLSILLLLVAMFCNAVDLYQYHLRLKIEAAVDGFFERNGVTARDVIYLCMDIAISRLPGIIYLCRHCRELHAGRK